MISPWIAHEGRRSRSVSEHAEKAVNRTLIIRSAGGYGQGLSSLGRGSGVVVSSLGADFVPAKHIAHFVREPVREGFDLRAILSAYVEERAIRRIIRG
jgi:hypothetical protein